jgi:hypothetical protein
MRHKMSKLKSKMKDAKTIKELTTPISADISMINGDNNYDEPIPSLSNILNDQDFASVSSIGNNPSKPHNHDPQPDPLPANPDDLFLDTSYLLPKHIKIDPSGYLKQLALGGPCDRQYPITSLGQNSMDFMRDFMKNFIVDPFYKLDLIADKDEIFEDFTEQQQNGFLSKEVKRCPNKRNKMLRESVERAVDSNEATRVRAMKDISNIIYKYIPPLEEDSEDDFGEGEKGGEGEGDGDGDGESHDPFEEHDSESAVEVEIPEKQMLKLVPGVFDVKEYLKTYDLQYVSN